MLTVLRRLGPHIGCLLLVVGAAQGPRTIGHLDPTGAFFYPDFAAKPDRVLAKTKAFTVDGATYLRYLATRYGTEALDDLVFDRMLEVECKSRGLAKNAVLLARPLGAKRFHESGRRAPSDPDGSKQRKFVNDALRKLRIDAIVRADREQDDWGVIALFNRRYGVSGERVRVRQILVSFRATRDRLEKAGKPAGHAAVVAAARKRIDDLARRVADEGFDKVAGVTDDRQRNGDMPGYNYQRYGAPFARKVRELAVGQVSSPVETRHGFHLIQLADRKITRLADVADKLRAEMRHRQTAVNEVQALRRRLLRKY